MAFKIIEIGEEATLLYGKSHWTLPSYLNQDKQALLQYLSQFKPMKVYIYSVIENPTTLYTSSVVSQEHDGMSVRHIIHQDLRALFS